MSGGGSGRQNWPGWSGGRGGGERREQRAARRTDGFCRLFSPAQVAPAAAGGRAPSDASHWLLRTAGRSRRAPIGRPGAGWGGAMRDPTRGPEPGTPTRHPNPAPQPGRAAPRRRAAAPSLQHGGRRKKGTSKTPRRRCPPRGWGPPWGPAAHPAVTGRFPEKKPLFCPVSALSPHVQRSPALRRQHRSCTGVREGSRSARPASPQRRLRRCHLLDPGPARDWRWGSQESPWNHSPYTWVSLLPPHTPYFFFLY